MIKHMDNCISSDYDKAVADVKNNRIACAILKNNEIMVCAKGHGITPLLNLYDEYGDDMHDTILVDKVIGKAAAMIAVLSGVRNIHTELISSDALELLNKNNIAVVYEDLVPFIMNQAKNGQCPIENALIGIDSLVDGIKAIRKRLFDLRENSRKNP